MSNKIEIAGMLCDDVYINRHNDCRKVFDTDGIAPTICAGCGMGGGITPKIVVYE